MAKLNVKAFGLACGIVWGGGIFIFGIVGMFSAWGDTWVAVMSSAYLGYQPTFIGSIIGGIWGFLDGGIGGLVLAWLYNKFAK